VAGRGGTGSAGCSPRLRVRPAVPAPNSWPASPGRPAGCCPTRVRGGRPRPAPAGRVSCCRPACSPTGPAPSRACSWPDPDGPGRARRRSTGVLTDRVLTEPGPDRPGPGRPGPGPAGPWAAGPWAGRAAAIRPVGAASPAPRPCRCAGPGTRLRLGPRRGSSPAGPVRCDQHLSTLADPPPTRDPRPPCCRGRRLAPLARLRPAQARPDRRDAAGLAAARRERRGGGAAKSTSHPQTVRYRMRQIHEFVRRPVCAIRTGGSSLQLALAHPHAGRPREPR